MSSSRSFVKSSPFIFSFGTFNQLVKDSLEKSFFDQSKPIVPCKQLQWVFQHPYDGLQAIGATQNGDFKPPKPISSERLNATNKKKKVEKQYNEEKLEKLMLEEEQFAKVHKKVKTNNYDNQTTRTEKLALSSSCNQFSKSEENIMSKDSSISTTSSVSKVFEDETEDIDSELKMKENIKRCKNINVFRGDDTKGLMFKIEYIDSGDEMMKTMIITRNQMVKCNPKLVLYFYENHLEFPNAPNFQIEKLKKI